MKALTIKQPWAGLVAAGIKLVENRPVRPPAALIGQRFAIHAGLDQAGLSDGTWGRIFEIEPDLCTAWVSDRQRETMRLAQYLGKVVAVATLADYVYDDTGLMRSDIAVALGDQLRWFFGPVGYVLADVRALKTPVPCRGMQGFWPVPVDVERQVLEQLGGVA